MVRIMLMRPIIMELMGVKLMIKLMMLMMMMMMIYRIKIFPPQTTGMTTSLFHTEYFDAEITFLMMMMTKDFIPVGHHLAYDVTTFPDVRAQCYDY